MSRAVLLGLGLLLLGCTASEPPDAMVPPPPPPPAKASIPTSPELADAPAKLRAEHASVIPREKAVVASADADAIARVHALDRNVQQALDELERDGGRHVTPNAVKRAEFAVRELEKHLREVEARAP